MLDELEGISMALKSLKKAERVTFKKSDLLSTGVTTFNLALTGKPNGGLVKGGYFFYVGDSESGKTFLTLTAMAEATINPEFDDYLLIFDNAENGALMDIEKFFGPSLAARLQAPAKHKDGSPRHSEYLEEFYDNLDDLNKANQPYIYVLDSMDALSSTYEEAKFKEGKEARRDPRKKAKGDYGDGKAKINSRNIRRVTSALRKSGSILIIINQTRDNIDAGLFESKKTRSGGRALKFYATAEIWTSLKTKLKKKIRSKEREIGMVSRIAVKKNRLTGKDWLTFVPMYFSIGVDDIGGCVDFLIEEGEWKKNKSGIIAVPEHDLSGYRDDLVEQIQEADIEQEIRKTVTRVWRDIEAKCVIKRKPKYGPQTQEETDEEPRRKRRIKRSVD